MMTTTQENKTIKKAKTGRGYKRQYNKQGELFCNCCQQWKHPDAYGYKSDSSTKKQPWCIECSTEYLSNYNRKLPFGLIYGMKSKALNQFVYVGECMVILCDRKSGHKFSAFNRNDPAFGMRVYEHIRDYGWNDIEWVVLDDTYSPTASEAFYIKLLRQMGNPLLNTSSGRATRSVRSGESPSVGDRLEKY